MQIGIKENRNPTYEVKEIGALTSEMSKMLPQFSVCGSWEK